MKTKNRESDEQGDRGTGEMASGGKDGVRSESTSSPSSSPSSSSSLSNQTILGYGAPAVVLAALALTFYVYLPKYYADVVGIDLTVLGIVVLTSRIWDAVIDPGVGALSDRTRTRWGRRQPWIAAGALPLAGSFILLVVIPHVADPLLEGLYLGALTFLFFAFWTMVVVPYESLGAELSFDYDERNRLLGFREAGVLAGTLLAASLPLLVGAFGLPEGDAGERARFWRVGWVYAALTVVLVGGCLLVVREREWLESQRPGAFWENLAGIWENRPFRILLSAYSFTAFGVSLSAALILFYTEHVLGSDRAPLFLVLYLGLGTVLVPFWVHLASRWEKRNAWVLAMVINSGFFATAIFLGRGDELTFAIIVALSALGVGGVMALPPSMQADTIDFDEWQTGTRREGEYIGLWSIVKKLAAALSAGLAFPILDMAGYVSGAPEQPATAVWTLRILYVAVPVACNVIAIVIASHYSIDRKMHAGLREEIDARIAVIGDRVGHI